MSDDQHRKRYEMIKTETNYWNKNATIETAFDKITTADKYVVEYLIFIRDRNRCVKYINLKIGYKYLNNARKKVAKLRKNDNNHFITLKRIDGSLIDYFHFY